MGQPIENQRAYFSGQLVQAAYAMLKNPQCPDPLRPEPAGYELGAWIRMSAFILDISEPKFYGIVVHSLDDPNSHIMPIRGASLRSPLPCAVRLSTGQCVHRGEL